MSFFKDLGKLVKRAGQKQGKSALPPGKKVLREVEKLLKKHGK